MGLLFQKITKIYITMCVNLIFRPRTPIVSGWWLGIRLRTFFWFTLCGMRIQQ